MTEPSLNHPGDGALRALSLGQLTEVELAPVAAHLDDCPACCRRLDQLTAADPLLARLQQIAAGRDEGLVSPAQRRPAVQALRQAQEAPAGPGASGRGEFASCYLDILRGSLGGPPRGPGKPTAPHSSLGGLRPVALRPLQGEGDRGVWAASDALPPIGATGDRYQLFGEIARGGMGAVLRGRDVHLGRDLAVKVLLDRYANLPEVAQRFVEEAQIGGQLQHPGIVPVYDIGRFGDRPFFAMKLVEGKTLAAILGERARPTDDLARLLNVALQVAQTLAYAHAKGVIHRDLKPANVMVGAFGEVQVMDWGLAKVLTDGGAEGVEASREEVTPIRTARGGGAATETGSILGTPAYMPPEQASGDVARLDRRADVFGLGAILCEILTGAPPYVGLTGEEVYFRAAAGDLTEAHARLDACGADPAVRALTKSCLAPAAGDRPRDAQAVADGLAAYLNGVQERLQAAERERAVAVVRAGEEGKRRKVQLALAAALVGLLLGGGAFAFWRAEQAHAGRERAARNAEAVAVLLDQCAEALRANDAAKAAVALGAAKKRAAEGGAEGQADRLGRLEADLTLARDLDAADQYRFTLVANHLPAPTAVATRTREALRRFGADPDAVAVEAAAARVAASVVRPRAVAALDGLLRLTKSAGVRALLGRVDADPYRDAVRDAAVAEDWARYEELVGRKAALEQPPGFVAVLGEYGAIPVERRRQLMEAAVRQQPGDLGLLMTLGQSYSLTQKLADERRWWFQAAVAAAPANAAAHNSLGVALMDRGEMDPALACFRKAIALDPQFADAHSNLGSILCDDRRDYEGAMDCFRKAIALDPDFAMAHANLGHARHLQGKTDEALAHFRKAIDLDPEFAGAHNGLGVVLAGRGAVDQAHDCFRRAIDLDPQFAGAYLNLGNVRRAQGQTDEAITHFRKAIALDPKLALAHLNLGVALAGRGAADEAIGHFRKAIALDPKNAVAQARAQAHLGHALAGKGEADEALACLRKAIDLDPAIADAHNDLGFVLMGQGQVDEAIASFRRAVTLKPKLFVAHANLGNALLKRGAVDEAMASFRTALAINGGNARARTLLARAERLAAIRDRFAAFQNGTFTPATPPECLDLIEWCQVKQLHHAAAGLYAIAFAADPRLADDLRAAHRYRAAGQAALAAAGRDEGAAKLDDRERARLRQQALAWLRADLALHTRRLETGPPAARAAVPPALRPWLEDRDLATLRDPAALTQLPAADQQAWAQLWADVAALLKQAEEK